MTTLQADEESGTISDNPDTPHSGFNLDGLASGAADPEGCNHEDFFSTLDPDQNAIPGCMRAGCGGVDNQLPSLAGSVAGVAPESDFNGTLRTGISSGTHLILLYLDGVDDPQNDALVTLTLLAAFDADADCDNNVRGTGRFLVAPQGFIEGDRTRPRWRAQGSIVDGRVRVAGFASPVRLPAPEGTIDVEGAMSQMRFDLSPPTCPARHRGNWGAAVDVETALEWYVHSYPGYELLIRMIAAGLVDIEHRGICADSVGSTHRYGRLGVGYAFDLAPAEIVGEADAPPPGTCGAPR